MKLPVDCFWYSFKLWFAWLMTHHHHVCCEIYYYHHDALLNLCDCPGRSDGMFALMFYSKLLTVRVWYIQPVWWGQIFTPFISFCCENAYAYSCCYCVMATSCWHLSSFNWWNDDNDIVPKRQECKLLALNAACLTMNYELFTTNVTWGHNALTLIVGWLCFIFKITKMASFGLLFFALFDVGYGRVDCTLVCVVVCVFDYEAVHYYDVGCSVKI